MIQRIQSIYLFLASALMVAINWLPLAEFNIDNQEKTLFTTFGIGNGTITTYPIAVIAILSATLSLIAIFMYKNRIRQIKVTSISLFLSIMFYAVFIMYWWFSKDVLVSQETSISYGLVAPAIAVILNFLAVRAIKADEKLVRSADRIR